MPDLDIPTAWERSARTISHQRWRTILVLGATDRGKSTYCAFLAARLATNRHRIALIDADVGQKDIGPPATITLGYLPNAPGRTDIPVAASYFVGSTTPMGQLLPMVVGVRRMRDAARAHVAIVNTTGFIHGAGRALKSDKIEALRPDVIVGLAAGDELDAILKAHRNVPTLQIRPSRFAAAKTTQQRTRNREHAFRRYFAKAREQVLPLGKLIIQRTLLFTGEPIDDPACLYAEQTAEGLVVVGATARSGGAAAKALPLGFEKNLLCGIADGSGDCRGLAILREIDFRARTVALLTPVRRPLIRILQFGRMYVTPAGTELGRAHV